MHDPTEINMNDLIGDWTIQGRLRRESGVELAEKSEELKDKKAYLKYKKGCVALEYRKGLRELKNGEGKIIKPTEGAINDLLDSDDELYKIEMEIIQLQKEVDVCSAYVEAINTKKYGLQEVGALWRSDYWSEPRVAEDSVKDKNFKAYEEAERKALVEEEREDLKKRRRRKKVEG